MRETHIEDYRGWRISQSGALQFNASRIDQSVPRWPASMAGLWLSQDEAVRELRQMIDSVPEGDVECPR